MALAGAGGPYQNYAESKTLIPGFVPQKLSEIGGCDSDSVLEVQLKQCNQGLRLLRK